MTDPTPIREPGVDVVQAVRSTPAAVSAPVLLPVVVGPCKKVLEVTLTDGSLNEDARIQLPAIYQSHLYLTGISPTASIVVAVDETLALEVNNGPAKTITFRAGTWTLNSFVTYVNEQIGTLALEILAVKVPTSSTLALARIQTLSKGESASLKATWTSGTTVLADGLKLPRTWFSLGYDQYSNDRLLVTQDLLPDPWSLRPDLDVLEDTVRGFLTSETAVKKEMYRTEAISRAGQSYLDMLDDGDGDGTTPLLLFKASAGAQKAYPTDIADLLIAVQDDNLPDFDAAPTSAVLVNTTVPPWVGGAGVAKTACHAATTAALPACTYAPMPAGTLTENGVGVGLPLIDGVTLVATNRLLVKNEAGNVTNGVYEVTTVGGPGVPFVLTRVADLDAQAEFPKAIVNILAGTSNGGTYWRCIESGAWGFEVNPCRWSQTYAAIDFWVQVDGWAAQRVQIANATGIIETDVLDAINDLFPRYGADPLTAIDDPVTPGAVRIQSFLYGRESMIRVWGTHAVWLFGAGTYPKIWRGNYQQVRVGDELWVDGSLLAVITQIVIGGVAGTTDAQIRLDREYRIDYFDDPITTNPTKHTWWIVSKNVTAQLGAALVTDYATPELYVTEYLTQFRHDVLRGNFGQPMYPGLNSVIAKAQLPVFYEALRLDVTAKATTRDVGPVLIQGNDFSGLDTQFSPVDAQNPLGLAGYFSLLNSDIVPIALLGVDEVSDAYPEGTPEAYARAFAVLQSYGVTYPISVLSQSLEVAILLDQHVAYMSHTKQKGERAGMVTFPIPTRDESALVGSGTKGNAADPGMATDVPFQTNLPDLADLFLAAGVTATSFAADGTDGVYLNIEGDAKNYMVKSYTGTTIVCTKSYTTTDSFWAGNPAAPTLWSGAIIDKTFSISVRGQLLLDTAGLPDKEAIAKAIGKRAKKFAFRRILVGAPGEVEATVDGIAQRLPTYYLAAATMAQRCKMLPSKPQSKSPVTGFSRVFNANGFFTESQMDIAAGYGIWWWKNDDVTGSVLTRMQLTSDPTSVKTREFSMTCALDYGAKAIRSALEPMVGTMTVNTQSVQQLTVIVQGVLDFLVQNRVWKGAHDPTVTIGPFSATPEDLAEGLSDGGEDEILVEVDAELEPPLNRVRVRIIV